MIGRLWGDPLHFPPDGYNTIQSGQSPEKCGGERKKKVRISLLRINYKSGKVE